MTNANSLAVVAGRYWSSLSCLPASLAEIDIPWRLQKSAMRTSSSVPRSATRSCTFVTATSCISDATSSILGVATPSTLPHVHQQKRATTDIMTDNNSNYLSSCACSSMRAGPTSSDPLRPYIDQHQHQGKFRNEDIG
jgi:hypothetical protein